eukprot:CAMPEP_0203761424 /NCGR_PEP_ID=MMETSP0098-20131031/14513_1 /ASSEMBLY_ACC=CAM_ASM_000208 /TAXON_ID=96639 /ORGANISM=" , Strain NY0313808BC1" /LENGTH=172 /DNA_ID=CAMNT_0050655417 /DNA_START=323 /DNA_END=838 /DNA_ORIENTATION=-
MRACMLTWAVALAMWLAAPECAGMSPLVHCRLDPEMGEYKVLMPGAAPGDSLRGELVIDPPVEAKDHRVNEPKSADPIVVQVIKRDEIEIPEGVDPGAVMWLAYDKSVMFVRGVGLEGGVEWVEYHKKDLAGFKAFANFKEISFPSTKPAIALLYDGTRGMWISLHNGVCKW